MDSHDSPKSLGPAVLVGTAAAIACGIGWGLVFGFWEVRSTFLGISLGIFVGLPIRYMASRVDPKVLLLGGVLSAGACLFGNVIGAAILVSRHLAIPLLDALSLLIRNGRELLAQDSLSPLSLAASAIAGIVGGIVSLKGSRPEMVATVLGPVLGGFVRADLPAPESKPAKSHSAPGQRIPVVEKRLSMRHQKPGQDK